MHPALPFLLRERPARPTSACCSGSGHRGRCFQACPWDLAGPIPEGVGVWGVVAHCAAPSSRQPPTFLPTSGSVVGAGDGTFRPASGSDSGQGRRLGEGGWGFQVTGSVRQRLAGEHETPIHVPLHPSAPAAVPPLGFAYRPCLGKNRRASLRNRRLSAASRPDLGPRSLSRCSSPACWMHRRRLTHECKPGHFSIKSYSSHE